MTKVLPVSHSDHLSGTVCVIPLPSIGIQSDKTKPSQAIVNIMTYGVFKARHSL